MLASLLVTATVSAPHPPNAAADAALAAEAATLLGQGGSSLPENVRAALRAVPTMPTLSAKHHTLGSILGMVGGDARAGDAVEHLRAGVAAHAAGQPGLPGLRRDLAQMLSYKVGDPPALAEAAVHYRAVLAAAPADADMQYKLGTCLAQLAKNGSDSSGGSGKSSSSSSSSSSSNKLREEAVASFRAAIAVQPDYAGGNAALQLGSALNRLGGASRRQEALDAFRAAVRAAPTDWRAPAYAAAAAFSSDARPPPAFQDECSSDARPPPAAAAAGLKAPPAGLSAMRQPERLLEAEQLYRRALALAIAAAAAGGLSVGEVAVLWIDLGMVLFQAGRLDGAERTFRDALAYEGSTDVGEAVGRLERVTRQFATLPRDDPSYQLARVAGRGAHQGMVFAPRLWFPFQNLAYVRTQRGGYADRDDGRRPTAAEASGIEFGSGSAGWRRLGAALFRPAAELLQPHARCREGRSYPGFGAPGAAAVAAAWGVPERTTTVHVRQLWPAAECAALVEASEARAAADGGWSTARHAQVPATDIAAARVPAVRTWLNEQLERAILPAFEHLYGVPRESLWLVDAFVVKYSAGSPQDHLPQHFDQSPWSAIISLNNATAYDGGGTHFMAMNRTVRADAGEFVSFSGRLSHGGNPVTRGTRYVLALFVNQDPAVPDNTRSREAYVTPGAQGNRFLRCNDTGAAPVREVAAAAPSTTAAAAVPSSPAEPRDHLLLGNTRKIKQPSAGGGMDKETQTTTKKKEQKKKRKRKKKRKSSLLIGAKVHKNYPGGGGWHRGKVTKAGSGGKVFEVLWTDGTRSILAAADVRKHRVQ
jgi:tetratricopeptide (TPR) repeat protein